MEEQPVVCLAVLESGQVALTHLSRDPDVRREAANVARATSRLLAAIRRSGAGPGPPQ